MFDPFRHPMRRSQILSAVVFSGLWLSSCRIEPTPQRFIDQTVPGSSTEVPDAPDIAAEITRALASSSSGELIAAMSPLPEAVLSAPDGSIVRDSVSVTRLLGSLDGTGRVINEQFGRDSTTYWFIAELEAPPSQSAAGTQEGGAVRLSGVLILAEGTWRLAQGHLSRVTQAVPPIQGSAPPPEGAGPP